MNLCHFCGEKNRFEDDIGLFYIVDKEKIEECLGREYRAGDYFKNLNDNERKSYPVCEDCFNGDVGDFHRSIFGMGER